MKSELEDKLLKKMAAEGLPSPAREYQFHPVRRWKLDFAFPRIKIGIEVDGGTWSKGRHTRGVGYAKDCEKFNAAVLLGWRVFHFTAEHIESGYAVKTIWRALGGPYAAQRLAEAGQV